MTDPTRRGRPITGVPPKTDPTPTDPIGGDRIDSSATQGHRAVGRDSSWLRRTWVPEYMRGRGDPRVPARPLVRSDLRLNAHRLLDLAGGDYRSARRALDEAADEASCWFEEDWS